jgi:hypothetical protein
MNMAQTVAEIMAAMAAGDLTAAEAQQQVEALMATAARRPAGKLSLKVSDNTGVIVVRLPSGGRYPVSLYAAQLVEMAQYMPDILRFAIANVGAIAAVDKVTAANPAGITAELKAALGRTTAKAA